MVTIQIKRTNKKIEKAPETALPGGRRKRSPSGSTRTGFWLMMKAPF
jgi:hypothetical protein